MRKINVGSIFTGIGAWEKALLDLNVEFDLKFFCEFDPYATQSYCSMYNESEKKNLGDITKVDVEDVPDVDVIFYSPPCQAFSVAGKQEGFDDKRGVLFFDALKVIEAKRPRLAIMENVKGLIGTKFTEEFCEMLYRLEDLGYTNSWKVLNAKDYGIPQNRERVFVVSLLSGEEFEFPKGEELKLRLKDMLEDEVDEKYYVSEEKTREFFKNNPEILNKIVLGNINPSGKGMNGNVYSIDGLSPTLTTNKGEGIKIAEPKRLGGLFDNDKKHQAGAIWESEGLCPTLDTMQGGWRQPCVLTSNNDKIISNFRIRRLTPTEYFRLQGFQDADIQKCIDAGLSNTQLYKQAGNSICVVVPKAILKKLFKL